MLRLPQEERARLWQQLVAVVENYIEHVAEGPVLPQDSLPRMADNLAGFDFAQPRESASVVEFVAAQLSRNQVHTPHPAYFGLFNPNTSTMSIVADTMVASFNPQLASRNHSPFAVMVEQHLVRYFGQMLRMPDGRIDGTFASGGAEANHTALLCALTHRFVQFRQKGLRSLSAQPLIYVSGEAHHSFAKAARLCGLGTDAVREVPVDPVRHSLDPKLLDKMIADDRRSGFEPVLIVATFGTTSSGVIDPIKEIAALATKHHIWYHIDAAWGGAAAFLPELASLFDGFEEADSITFDCHKWLSVPMGAGLFLTRHREVLDRTFRVSTAYMPKYADEVDLPDPYAHSMQWSRRFIGLKVFMTLATHGAEGYAEAIRHQVAMGGRLRERLAADGWSIVNDSLLPIVCVTGTSKETSTMEYLDAVVAHVIERGNCWVSTTKLGTGTAAIRACITNYATTEADIDRLVVALSSARADLVGAHS